MHSHYHRTYYSFSICKHFTSFQNILHIALVRWYLDVQTIRWRTHYPRSRLTAYQFALLLEVFRYLILRELKQFLLKSKRSSKHQSWKHFGSLLITKVSYGIVRAKTYFGVKKTSCNEVTELYKMTDQSTLSIIDYFEETYTWAYIMYEPLFSIALWLSNTGIV